MKLSHSAQDLIAKFSLGFVATVRADGTPAVSPKGTFLVLDESTIAFGDIRSPGTVANLAHQPEVEVNFIDVFKRKGLRVRGRAEVITRTDARFNDLIPRWHDVWDKLAARVQALVVISVEEARPLTTPPYDDGATEEEMIALYQTKFAEIYP